MTKITYECAACHEMITEDWNDETAKAELERDYPEDAHKIETHPEELVRVCNPCYKKITNKLGKPNGHTIQ